MSVAPIIHRVTVAAAPARAFELFLDRMGAWWPKGRAVGALPHVAIVVEPRVGGRWFERDAEGTETRWGTVLEWQPPYRVLLGWQLNSRFEFDPDLVTEVEVTFVAMPAGGTEVTLEHRGLERFGADAEKLAGQLGSGWPRLVAEFVKLAEADGASRKANASEEICE